MGNYDVLYEVLLCIMKLGAFRKDTLRDGRGEAIGRILF